MPVLHGDRLAADSDLKTGVAQLAVVGPVVVDTADGVLEALQCQQVFRAMYEIVGFDAQAVVEEVSFEADIELRRRFPLDFLVTDVGQLGTNLRLVIADSAERGAGGIIADAVVTAHVEARIQAQIADQPGLGEPVLVGQHPA